MRAIGSFSEEVLVIKKLNFRRGIRGLQISLKRILPKLIRKLLRVGEQKIERDGERLAADQ